MAYGNMGLTYEALGNYEKAVDCQVNTHYHIITYTITLSHFATIPLSHTLSHYPTITLSHYHTITLSHSLSH
jgi:prephenate dehydrogenase